MFDTALRGAGYDPRFTPVDTLMDAPLGVHLAAAAALTDDNDFPDEELEGFSEADLEMEAHENRILNCDAALCERAGADYQDYP